MDQYHDPWLSAYLDGELDEARRLSIEAGLAADPRLARELAELTRTRDLIAGISRPRLASSLADDVVARLDARNRPSTIKFPFERLDGPRSLALGAGLLAAAALLIATTLSSRPSGKSRGGPAISIARDPGPVDTHPSKPLEHRTSKTVADDFPAELEIAQADASPLPSEPSRGEADRERGRADLIALLDRPGARRWLIEIDPVEFDRVKREVDAIVAHVRLEHPARGRIEPNASAAIDSERTGRSVVHVLELDRLERAGLHLDLLAKVPEGSLRQDRPDPPTLTALIEQDDVRVVEGPAVGIVRAPIGETPAHLKKEAPPDRLIFLVSPDVSHGRENADRMVRPEDHSQNLEDETATRPVAEDDDDAPLLVWLVEKRSPRSSKKASSR